MDTKTIQKHILIFILLLLSGCNRTGPALTPLLPDATILAFGDSLTYGTGAKNDESYPAVLEQLSGIRVINAGIPGELSTDGLSRLPDLLDEYQPQLLILCHGGNDILRHKLMSAMADNVKKMIMEAGKRDIEVVLIGVPQFALLFYKSDERYQQIANEFNIPYEADILPMIEGDDDLKSDAIHPNAKGYRKMAKALHKLLQTSGAL